MSNHNGNANKMVSDTPRTDARVKRMIDNGQSPEGLEHWARNLERELNAANQRIKRLEEDSERLNWLLNRGLAWRDCYDNHWINGEWLYASQDAIETIDKAREAKP